MELVQVVVVNYINNNSNTTITTGILWSAQWCPCHWWLEGLLIPAAWSHGCQGTYFPQSSEICMWFGLWPLLGCDLWFGLMMTYDDLWLMMTSGLGSWWPNPETIFVFKGGIQVNSVRSKEVCDLVIKIRNRKLIYSSKFSFANFQYSENWLEVQILRKHLSLTSI